MAKAGLSRHIVYGQRGMVCSNSPLAASAGIKIMQDGGNAFDAALAVAATEAVTLVPVCGLGGDSFVLLHEAATGIITGINSSGAAATGATADFYRNEGHRTMPIDGPHSASVPGEVAAWEEIHRRFCSQPISQLLDSAISYAEDGFPVSPNIARSFQGSLSKLAKHPSSDAIYLTNGNPPAEGDILKNRDLARSLQRVVDGGANEFYRGGLAKEIVKAHRKAGGLFTEDDFANHHADVYDPITTTYHGHTIYQTRPPSQGYLLLQMLNLVEEFDLTSLGQNSAAAIHLMVEAKKVAFDDRNRLAGDPKFVEWPLDELIGKPYGDSKRGLIKHDSVAQTVPALQPVDVDGDTTYFCVADGDGNCVSWIHSLSAGFGSGLVADGTGILLNNRAGRGFSLEPGHPNIIEPGKRTMHTLNCYIATRDGSPVIIGGTPGGDFQAQCGLQILTDLIDFGMDPQEAVEAPRWWSFPGTDPETLGTPTQIFVESEMQDETVRNLENMGHKVVRKAPDAGEGRVQLIIRDPQRGMMMGASDSRGDGHAAAW